jgi:protein transport protein SEC24
VDAASFPRLAGNEGEGLVESKLRRDPYSADINFLRLSVNAIPNSVELKKQWCLPTAALVRPLAPVGNPVPVVNFGAAGIIRCRQCRTYVNPYVQFTDGGRRWKCNVCGTFNEVPVEYFCTTDSTGIRRDINERPELNCGSVEYLAPEEYMVRPPMPPSYVFAFDVSYPAIASGLLVTAIDAVRSCLDNLPGAERTQIGIITYDSTVHFYKMRADQASPQMLVIPDVTHPYLPQPEDLLVNLHECRSQVDAALDVISKAFGKTQDVEGNISGAVQAAYLIMQHVGGKMVAFQSSVPTQGEGKLRLKEDLASYNTEREYKLRKAEDPFFNRFGGECNRIQMCIDLFCCPPKFTDVASISQYSSTTGGQFYFYPAFFARKDGQKLNAEITRNLSRETGWEAVMRVRMGKGLKCTNFHGHFMIRSNDLMALPTIDPDKAVHVDIGYEEQMVPHQTTYMQCALLYTTSYGERRIRVHTMAIPVVSDVGELFKACDSCATGTILARLAAEKIRTTTIKETVHILNKKCADILKEYRQLYSTHLHPHNKLILPETMKMLPLLTLCMQKSNLLKGPNEVTTDERSNTIYQLLSMPFENVMKFLYPRMYPLHDLNQIVVNEKDGSVTLPATLPLTLNSIKENGIYLLDNGLTCYLWIGRGISPQWLVDVFGLSQNPNPQELMSLQVGAAPQDNNTSRKVLAVVNSLRENNIYHQHCHVVRQGDPQEAMILPWLVEDKYQTMYSYTNYLGYLHKGILSR